MTKVESQSSPQKKPQKILKCHGDDIKEPNNGMSKFSTLKNKIQKMRTDKKGNKSHRWRQEMKKNSAAELESPSSTKKRNFKMWKQHPPKHNANRTRKK